MPARTFVIQLGRALHALGSASYRVEDAMDACARRFGLHGSFFCTPTAIFAAIAEVEQKAETVLVRVEPGQNDLRKLADLYAVRDLVMQDGISPDEGIQRLAAIMESPPTNGALLPIPAQSLAAATACVFLGGGPAEIAVAAGSGLAVGLMAFVARFRPAFARVFEPLACAVAAFVVHMCAAWQPLNVSVATVAAVIVLLPGLTFTTALAELTMRHLASGSARLLGSIATMLTMAVGVALGSRLGALAFGEMPLIYPASLPGWAQVPALLGAGLAFAVLLRASPRQWLLVLLAVSVAWVGSRLGAAKLDVELAALSGSFVVSAVANLYSRFCRRPAAVLRTPGLLLLVPGSLGLRGLTAVLQYQNFNAGIELAFKMLLIGGSLVAGLLIAGLVVPSPLDIEPDSRLLAHHRRGYAPRPSRPG